MPKNIFKTIRNLFFILAVASLSVVVWYFTSFRSVSAVVEGRVYRSSQLSAERLERLIQEKGIRTIINLRGKFTDAQWYINENNIAKKHGINFYSFSLLPHEMPEYLQLMDILDKLFSAERPILVHCYKGADRTGMVSALALAIEQDLPLPELKKQFSFRYGVFPFYRSIGPSFFSVYEDWLTKSHKTHTKRALIYWMSREYQDSHNNIQFWIDRINDTDLSSVGEGKVTLPADTENIVIRGWSFHARARSPVNELYVTLGNSISVKADPVHNRPDVARYFDLGREYYQTFIIGWEVEFKRDSISTGCHEISFRIMKDGAKTHDIPTGRKICLKKTF